MNIKNKALVVLSPLFLLCCTSLEPITIETSISIISQTIYGPFTGNEGRYPITFSYHYEGFRAYLFERLSVWNENTGLIVSENPKHQMFGGNYTATLYFDTTVLKNFVDATLTFEIYVGNVRYYLNDFIHSYDIIHRLRIQTGREKKRRQWKVYVSACLRFSFFPFTSD